eukprot:4376525-Amphidinium_carterae.1
MNIALAAPCTATPASGWPRCRSAAAKRFPLLPTELVGTACVHYFFYPPCESHMSINVVLQGCSVPYARRVSAHFWKLKNLSRESV